MARQKVIYFGHPINTYDTELEKQLLNVIQSMHPTHIIESPNQPHHRKAYQEWSKRDGKVGMDYFYEEVLPNCDEGIFLAFRDGKWGSGVFGEINVLDCLMRNTYQIFVGRKHSIITKIDIWEELVHVLSIKETCTRVRDRDGNLLPY